MVTLIAIATVTSQMLWRHSAVAWLFQVPQLGEGQSSQLAGAAAAWRLSFGLSGPHQAQFIIVSDSVTHEAPEPGAMWVFRVHFQGSITGCMLSVLPCRGLGSKFKIIYITTVYDVSHPNTLISNTFIAVQYIILTMPEHCSSIGTKWLGSRQNAIPPSFRVPFWI